MWRTIMIISVLVTATLALGMSMQAPAANKDSAKLRVGVYDNRAIAIAYTWSELSPTVKMGEEYEQAKAAGNDKRIKELEEWGPKYQRQLHRQGFSRVPVTEMLEAVKDKLPDLAKELDIDVIAFECNYLGPNVEKVDITLDLVGLYNPSEKTMKIVKGTLKLDPIDLDDLESDHDH